MKTVSTNNPVRQQMAAIALTVHVRDMFNIKSPHNTATGAMESGDRYSMDPMVLLNETEKMALELLNEHFETARNLLTYKLAERAKKAGEQAKPASDSLN